MPLEIALFVLRIIIAILLYAFLGALFWIIWRDLKASNARLDASQRQLGQLLVVEGENGDVLAGQELAFPLQPVTTVGRSPTNTVVLSDSFASAQHALILLRGSQWWLEDLESRNGTLLNDHLLEEPAVVSTGDIIGIGRFRLRLELK